MAFLLDEPEVKWYEEFYEKGGDHAYPNEHIVRTVKWFFPTKTGRVLDYGFGPGENLFHLMMTGYEGYGIEVSQNAKKLVERKLRKHPEFGRKIDLRLLGPADETLPWKSNYFDYIVSNQVIYFLFSKVKIIRLLNEFNRVLKPRGKFIISTMGKSDMRCTKGKEVGPDLFEYSEKDVSYDGGTSRHYILRDEQHARELFSMFHIDEVGFFAHSYCGVTDHHYLILGEKKA